MEDTRDPSLPDTERHLLIWALPAAARPYALLARFDRPIGWWLLFWPCVWGVALAGGAGQWLLLLWLLLGAVVMRAAGCVYNDIVDRDLDRNIARTRDRPLASGRVSLKAAWAWLVALSLVGLVVLLQLRLEAQIVALASLALVAAYPFMKRITWWPQAWLGLVFSWGALVGWVAVTGDWRAPPMAWLYVGAVFWVVGYDTIYALQDIEDDALAGIRSSARRLGPHARLGVALLYAAALGCWCLGLWQVRPQWFALLALAPMALHLLWQVATLDATSPEDALAKFRSNREAGLLMALACFVVGSTA
ncbi:MAG: 4-hydroxybenzoate octaprenyltransferase [Sphingomonadales bacterium]|nr:4-hydroxybenzoate octaprenyltransferase [Sphingomonadales bacterium]